MRTFACGGEMVWYNITAYNIKVKFVLRNNKEKVICNNKNAEGVMQMKCKRNLERAIVLGLILSTGVYGSAWAEDFTWNEKTDESGTGAVIDTSKDYNNVKVILDEAYETQTSDTSTALTVKGKNIVVNVTGKVFVENTAEHAVIDNNNAIYVRNYATLNINSGDNEVYIAAIGADGTGREDAAISAKYDSHFNLTGNNVKIIGNVDFANLRNGGSGTNNDATITLNSNKSFWYGNEAQAPVKGQFTDAVNEVASKLNIFDSIKLNAAFNIINENEFNNIVKGYLGKGTLNLTLNNGAEWVYNSNGTEYTAVDKTELGNLLKTVINEKPELAKLFQYMFNESPNDYVDRVLGQLDETIDMPTISENDTITSINLNGGVVNLNDDDIKDKYADLIDKDNYNQHHKVKIQKLGGSGGIFKVDLDWDSNKGKKYTAEQYDEVIEDLKIEDLKTEERFSDYIYIENVDNTTKTNPVQIVDFDASKAHLENMEINKDKLYFANVKNGTTSFITASSVYSNAGNVFDYTYGTGSEKGTNGTDWYIAVSGKSAESNPNFSAAKGAMYAGYALGTELDTLNKRMGEARYLEEDDGIWVRYRHSKTGWDDTYETNGDMFQLGFDNEVTEKDGKHYRGVALDYTDADTSIMGISGDGEHERYAVSLYDTWLGEKGHYRDLVLRGGRINSDYDVSGAFSSGYEDIGGDYHQWFGSISAEWGRKNDMGTGWYFEPQVQAQLARIGGASYVSDSGIDVDQDGATSLIGRAGFRIGREYVKDNGKHDNFYIKADLLHEFAGDKSFSLTGNDGRYDKEYDGQETWCDIGIGADISLGKNSYFWADVERTFGADFDNTWQINGGFRWEF